MAAGHKGVGGGLGVYIKAWFTAQPQRNVGPLRPTHGALPLLALCVHLRVASPSPAVVAVHVTAAQVGPGLLFIQYVLASQTGEGQRVEAHGALRPPSVQLLPQRLQVLDCGRLCKALGGAPQQSGAAQVDEGAVHQLVSLSINLQNNERSPHQYLHLIRMLVIIQTAEELMLLQVNTCNNQLLKREPTFLKLQIEQLLLEPVFLQRLWESSFSSYLFKILQDQYSSVLRSS